jgi:NAD(P)-dependent dehydrogenase (short-subunit alcohol dehydrogenase family)
VTPPIALVTGASRGIGAACAVALAETGHDVALAARTDKEGTGVLDGDLSGARPDAPIAGSLEATSQAVEQLGRRSLKVRMDVSDLESVESGVDRVLAEWGRVDVVVNVAHYRGPGYDAGLIGTPLAVYEKTLTGDILAPLLILQKVVPGMIERGSGTIVQMSSFVAGQNPSSPPGKGGWGLAYAVGKGGFDRIAGVLSTEVSEHGVLVYNVEPGLTAYGERLEVQRELYPWADIQTPESIGAAVSWLVGHPEQAAAFRDKRIHLPKVFHDYCGGSST